MELFIPTSIVEDELKVKIYVLEYLHRDIFKRKALEDHEAYKAAQHTEGFEDLTYAQMAKLCSRSNIFWNIKCWARAQRYEDSGQKERDWHYRNYQQREGPEETEMDVATFMHRCAADPRQIPREYWIWAMEGQEI